MHDKPCTEQHHSTISAVGLGLYNNTPHQEHD